MGEFDLTSVLNNSENTVTREKMITDRLKYEFKLASFYAGVPMQIFSPEVDRDGYDLILLSDYKLYYLQIKSTLCRDKNWSNSEYVIHKSILRPDLNHSFVYDKPLPKYGLGGGILVVVIKVLDENIEFGYYFTSYEVLKLIEHGVINKKANKRKASQVLKDLYCSEEEQVKLTKTCFVRAKGTDELLAICGMHSKYSNLGWKEFALRILNETQKIDESEKNILVKELREIGNQLYN